MQWKNSSTRFGAIAKFFHWSSAVAFIVAYILVYYVIWFLDYESPFFLPVLNIHWVLGVLVGILVIPRLVWRFMNVQPDDAPGSKAEHRLAHLAHWGLYGLLIILPLSGYLGTGAATDFGLFAIPSFRDTDIFAWMTATWGITWETFEPPVDVVHHFIGKWITGAVVLLHIAAALYHHKVRRDNVLTRMLPGK